MDYQILPTASKNSLTNITNAHIVGVGASAGGLEALEQFFGNTPSDLPLAYVVVQHLSPDFKSMMDDILSRVTDLKIRMIENDMSIEVGTIYLLPPNKEVICSEGKLLLTERSEGRELSFPIDQFFRSLADDAGHRAIAVILSGTGTDGSRGICHIHEEGGFVVVQDTSDCKFDGMPVAAMETGIVDVVAPANEISSILVKFLGELSSRLETNLLEDQLTMEGPIFTVFHLLKKQCGVDFADYKTTTIGRRVQRRLMLSGLPDIESYVDVLKKNPDEVERLYKDLLIGVTRFFRDREVFERLEMDVLPRLFEKLQPNQEFRVWVGGTATGEEAYSLAIIISEYMSANDRIHPVKIFATDIHHESLETSSRAVYSEESVSGVSSKRLERFFIEKADGYHVTSELRNMVVCVTHNMIRDAPFTKIHLLTCRNALIYFNTHAQNKVLSLFHFALNRDGILCLGPSETLGELANEFTTIDERTKLYAKHRDMPLPSSTRLPVNVPKIDVFEPRQLTPQPHPATNANSLINIYDSLLTDFMPLSLLVDQNGSLLHVFEGADQFLQKHNGRVSTDICDLVHPDLKPTFLTAFRRVREQKGPIQYKGLTTIIDGKNIELALLVRPYSLEKTNQHYILVQFICEGVKNHSSVSEVIDVATLSGDELLELEQELQDTRDNLQTIIEQSQSTNEELQSTNEQLISSNEELQSTNEELHSVNEELYTVNAEHQRKIEELTELTNDMDNLLATTNVHTVFLDLELRIRRFTPGIAQTFNLIAQDVGRKIDSFTYSIIDADLVLEIKHVLEVEAPFEREVRDRNDCWYLMRILPYRSDGKVDGVVLTLIDITMLKVAERKLADLSEIVEHSDDAIMRLSIDGIVTTWNGGAEKLFGFTREEVIGNSVSVLIPQKYQKDSQVVFDETLNGVSVERFETKRKCKDGQILDVSLTLSPIRNDLGVVVGACEIIRDVTARKLAEKEVRKAVKNRDHFLATLSHELRNPMAAVLNATTLLHEDGVDSETELEAHCIIERNVRHVARLLDDLLDLSRFTHDKLTLHKQVFNLNDLTMDVIGCVQSQIDEKGHQLHIQADPEPIYIDGDIGRIQQAQVNLLVNAAKYTKENGRIDYSIQKQNGQAVICIRDNGIGISENLLNDIFKPFVQSEQALDRSQGGMGLGLPLVKMIIEAHDGTIEAHSPKSSAGSEFILQLPLTNRLPEQQAKIDTDTASGLKMVIVEDNMGIRKMLAASMKLKGFYVKTANDGNEGLDTILDYDPDIALIDIGLPDVNGYELAKMIRTKPGFQNLLLAAVTGYGRESDRKKAMDAGFDIHLVKPLDPNELLATVSKSLSERASSPKA